jgi:ABC-type uncharacterized transport system auxiliary subunit
MGYAIALKGKNMNISISKSLIDSIESISDIQYMYLNWIQAAANWVSREPHKYTKSIKSAIQKDPAFALMTKGDIARAEYDAKMALQRKLINNENDPYTY